MEIVVIIACLLSVVLPISILAIGIQREKNKRVNERDKMFHDDGVKSEKSIKRKSISPKGIDAVEEISKILKDDVEKAIKSETKSIRKKPVKSKKPEFPIEPADSIKPKSRRGRKPRNKDKNSGDQMLLS